MVNFVQSFNRFQHTIHTRCLKLDLVFCSSRNTLQCGCGCVCARVCVYIYTVDIVCIKRLPALLNIHPFGHKMAVVTKRKSSLLLSCLIWSLLSAFKQPISKHDSHHTPLDNSKKLLNYLLRSLIHLKRH